jgi:hypothetical protein
MSGQGYIGNDAAADRIQEATDSKTQVANSYKMYKLGSTKGSWQNKFVCCVVNKRK